MPVSQALMREAATPDVVRSPDPLAPRRPPPWPALLHLGDRLDSFHDFIVLVGAQGHLLFANRSWCRAVGYDPAEIGGLHCHDVSPPEQWSLWDRCLDPNHPPGEIGSIPLSWRTKSGHILPAEGSLHVCPENGSPVRLLGIFQDLSQLAGAQAALRESEAAYHVIETRAPVGIFQTDMHGRLVRTNKRWRLIANLDHVTEPRGVWWQMVEPGERERVLAEWRSAQRHRREYRGEFRVNAGADVERYARTILVQSYAKDGLPGSCIGVSEDVTEQRRFETQLRDAQEQLERRVRIRTSQLEAANRELAQFAHVVAHDLKAPLRGVNNVAEWLSRDYEEVLDPNGKRLLSLIRQRVQHMHDLIEGILAYTRFGQVAEAEIHVDLQELVTHVLSILAPSPGILFRIPPSLPTVRGVPERLRHIFQNLFDNAIKFMDKPQGLVTLSVKRLPQAWEFAVRDNGSGIPERYHHRVFKMFEQLPGRRKTSGTGIGLALVKRIVEARGGEVRLDSTEGEGATFTFTWPDLAVSEEGHPLGSDPEI